MENQAESGDMAQCQGDGTKCAECGKLFSHAFYFGTHIVTHVAEKPFQAVGQCGMCGLVFSNPAVYESHMISLQSRLDAMAPSENEGEMEQDEEQQPLHHLADFADKEQMEPPPFALPDLPDESPRHRKQPKQQQQHQQHSSKSPARSQPVSVAPQEPQHSIGRIVSPTGVAKPRSKDLKSESLPEFGMESKPDSKPKVKPVPESEPLKAEVKPESEIKTDDPAVIVKEETDANKPVAEELPKKRIRRAPDKYEVYPEVKKRRVVKKKPERPPGYDPEVEKYLQSLRDMGYAVAPDTMDMKQGRQPIQSRGPPPKRGRGMAASGRGLPMAGPSFGSSRQPKQTMSQYKPMGMSGMGNGGRFPPPRGVMGSGSSSRGNLTPLGIVRNSSQGMQAKRGGYHPSPVMHKGVYPHPTGGARAPGVPAKVRQEGFKSLPPVQTYFPMPVNNRRNTYPAAPPPKPKPKVTYRDYDYEDEIVHLINGDLEIMPVSGKLTRGERLKQRQERLSQEGPGEKAKKSTKYFPRNPKQKTKRTPKKGGSPPSKRQRISPLSDLRPVLSSIDMEGVNYSPVNASIQITNVHSLHPGVPTYTGGRGSRARGKHGRWSSNYQSSSSQRSKSTAKQQDPQGQGHVGAGSNQQDDHKEKKELVMTTERGTVHKMAGRMEDLREEARKQVEEMLASPAVFLMDHESLLSNVGRVEPFLPSEPEVNRPTPSKLFVASDPRSYRARSSGRGRASSRSRGGQRKRTAGGRGRSHVGRASQAIPQGGGSDLEVKNNHASEEQADDGNVEDKEEIVEGTDIDGWTVSITRMSDSDGDHNSDNNEEDGSEKGKSENENSTQKLDESTSEVTTDKVPASTLGDKISISVTENSSRTETSSKSDDEVESNEGKSSQLGSEKMERDDSTESRQSREKEEESSSSPFSPTLESNDGKQTDSSWKVDTSESMSMSKTAAEIEGSEFSRKDSTTSDLQSEDQDTEKDISHTESDKPDLMCDDDREKDNVVDSFHETKQQSGQELEKGHCSKLCEEKQSDRDCVQSDVCSDNAMAVKNSTVTAQDASLPMDQDEVGEKDQPRKERSCAMDSCPGADQETDPIQTQDKSFGEPDKPVHIRSQTGQDPPLGEVNATVKTTKNLKSGNVASSPPSSGDGQESQGTSDSRASSSTFPSAWQIGESDKCGPGAGFSSSHSESECPNSEPCGPPAKGDKSFEPSKISQDDSLSHELQPNNEANSASVTVTLPGHDTQPENINPEAIESHTTAMQRNVCEPTETKERPGNDPELSSVSDSASDTITANVKDPSCSPQITPDLCHLESTTSLQEGSSSTSSGDHLAESSQNNELISTHDERRESGNVELGSVSSPSPQTMPEGEESKTSAASQEASQSQRLDAENGYDEDDTDNFSEIEKTCQEIIRDSENQVEARRANLENS